MIGIEELQYDVLVIILVYAEISSNKARDKTNKNGMCAQRRLRSAWSSAQSDQSLRCPHEEILGP